MEHNNKFVPVSKAAAILACSQERIHELCDQGLIRRHCEGDQVYVRSEDVAELRRLDIVGEMKPGEMVRRLLMLEQEVRRLQGAVGILYEVNRLAASRFVEMNDEQIVEFYEMINELLGESDLDPAQMSEMAEMLMRMTEVEIDRLNELLNLDNAWLPFMEICLHLTRSVISHSELATSIELQKIHTKLIMARRNLTGIAMFFIEKAGVLGPSRKLLAKIAEADLDAFDIIARKVKREGCLTLVK